MITYATGDLLQADAEALVNTVNCVGVMGKGIALQFKRRFPDNFHAYEKACTRGEVAIGTMFVTETGHLDGPRYVINFPTKEHWRRPSRLSYIDAGLRDLVRVLRDANIRSVAVPPLGTGNGGLDWVEVEPRLIGALQGLPDVHATIYPPAAGTIASSLERRPRGATRQLAMVMPDEIGPLPEPQTPTTKTDHASKLDDTSQRSRQQMHQSRPGR